MKELELIGFINMPFQDSINSYTVIKMRMATLIGIELTRNLKKQ